MADNFKLEEFLPFRLSVLAQELSQQLSHIYSRHFGLDIPQWRILANLASRGAMTAQSIARLTLSHKSTISRAVAQLESRGLIERVPSRNDGRELVLRQTATGRKLFSQLLPLVRGFETDLLARLSKDQQRALEQGLSALESIMIKKPD